MSGWKKGRGLVTVPGIGDERTKWDGMKMGRKNKKERASTIQFGIAYRATWSRHGEVEEKWRLKGEAKDQKDKSGEILRGAAPDLENSPLTTEWPPQLLPSAQPQAHDSI